MMRCPSGLASPDPFLNVDASKERRVAPKNIVRVVLWMSGALLLFSAMAVSVRVLAATLGVMEILALRAGPGLATFQPGALLTLVAAFGLAIALIATKKLTRTDSTFAIVFWMMLIQLPLALAGSDPLFVTKLNQGQVPAVIGIGVTGLLSHYCLTNAFRAGDAGVVVPLDFMRIPLIAVIGWWLYGERLDVFVFLGAGLIITGVLWNLRSEAARVQGSEH